jgi:putative hydrolase of the HAD superfamily
VSRFKGLILDFGGVLTNPLHEVMRDFCRGEGLAPDALVELFTRDARGRAAFADVERGRITQREWEAVTAGLLGVSDQGLLRRVMATLAPAKDMLQVVEDARAAGYATACLTNSFGLEPYDPYEPWELDKRFDLVVISEREKLRKPEIEIYQRTLQRLELPGEACLYLDDIEANLAPARQLGMTAWLVRDPRSDAARVAAELSLSR